jgi:hypothetical protein
MEDKNERKRSIIGLVLFVLGLVCVASLLAWELIDPKPGTYDHIITLFLAISCLVAVSLYLTLTYRQKSGPWFFLRKDEEGEKEKPEIQ